MLNNNKLRERLLMFNSCLLSPFFSPKYRLTSMCDLHISSEPNPQKLFQRDSFLTVRKLYATAPRGNVYKVFSKPRSSFQTKYAFVNSREVADKIASIILDSVKSENVTVIEVNSGPGILTKCLLEKGLRELIIYDHIQSKELTEVIFDYKDRLIKLHSLNLLHMTSCLTDNIRIFTELEEYKDKKVILIGSGVNRVFFRRIMESILWGWKFYKNIEFFFVLDENIYCCFTCCKPIVSQYWDYAMFDATMTIEVLDKFKSNEFLPPLKTETDMFLTRIKPKNPLPLPAQDIIFYSNFLKIFRKKYYPVIKILESWFPDSGLLFIAEGLDITVTLADLNASDMLKIFYIVKNLPEFDESLNMLRSAHIS